jgi:hypothetical protein
MSAAELEPDTLRAIPRAPAPEPVVIGLTIYVILDIEFPRAGLIRVDAFDHALVDLLNSMK